MASDNSGMLMKVGIAGAVGYYAYSRGWLSALGIGAPAAAAPAAVVPVAAVNPNAITGANTLDGLFAKMVTAAKAPAAGASVDEWNYWLGTVGNFTPPDPMPLFTAAVPGFDRAQPLTAGQYWAVMAPAVKTQLGLAGFRGLGAIGNLAYAGWL